MSWIMLGYCCLMIYAGFDPFNPAFWPWMSMNNITTVPSHYATAVEEEKNKRRMTIGHHVRPVVKVKRATPHFPLDLWLWLLEIHIKKGVPCAEWDHPSFHHSSSIGFSLNFIVLILFSSFVKWELSGGLSLQGCSKGEKSSLRALLFQSRSSIRFSLEYWLVLISSLYMAE